MDNLKWISPSRIVAIIDLILSSIWLLVMIVTIIIGTVATFAIQNLKTDPDVKLYETNINVDFWIMGIVVAVASTIVGVDIWAAIMLLNATKERADHVEVVKRARIWRNVNITFFILSLMNFFAATSYYVVVVALVFRGIIIYIVFNFVKELDLVIETSGVSNLDIIVVNKQE